MRQLVERLPEDYQLRHGSYLYLHELLWKRVSYEASWRASLLVIGQQRRCAVAEDIVRLELDADPSRDWGTYVDVSMRFRDSRIEWWRVDISDAERGPVGEFCGVDWFADDIREDTP